MIKNRLQNKSFLYYYYDSLKQFKVTPNPFIQQGNIMFCYSEIHNWQGESAVKQILVFPSELLKNEFDKEFAERLEKDGIEKASDSNAGAVYKLRAVKNGKWEYIPVIRCGSSGEQLWEGQPHPNWKTCLLVAHNHLWASIVKSMPVDLLTTLTDSHTELVQGKIPAFTECFYKAKCQYASNGQCRHKGTEHNVSFSCATARAFKITKS